MKPALQTGPAHTIPLAIGRRLDPACVASVTIPARNEQDQIEVTLDALRIQRTCHGTRLKSDSYEVILLLNNCTDGSAAVAERYRERHPEFRLHVVERTLAPADAHVGTARRLLMDEACARLESLGQDDVTRAILTTDGDTQVAPDWIARNLEALEAGADVVGGVIRIHPEELEALEPATRLAYERDARYQSLVAELEALLDPDPADPWPRHLQHFGASLGCTCEIYRRCGGLPPVKPLEDVAFVDALRKVGARIRHAPDVHIETSARLDGRAEVGLSGQLRHWREDAQTGAPHMVDSAGWLAHRFTSLAGLRRINEGADIPHYPPHWHKRLQQLQAERHATPRFLELLDCNALIEQTFAGTDRCAEITSVIRQLQRLLKTIAPAPAHQAGSGDAAAVAVEPTLAG